MLRLALPMLLVVSGVARAECRDDRLTLTGGFGEAHFTVRVADDPAERAQGLMHVESMATLEGMLFAYDEPQSVSFWMENTLIPLDMLFAGADGTILAIHENAVPMDRTPIPGGDGVQYVLEINGGLAETLGIEPGDVLQHPAIEAGEAGACS